MDAEPIHLDRPLLQLAGTLWLFAGILYLTCEAIAAASFSGYSYAYNYISDLGVPYNALIETPIADLNNAGQGGFAGSITAALFLRRFVELAKCYVHFDIFGWTPTPKPGRPKGGEAQAMRALFAVIAERFSK